MTPHNVRYWTLQVFFGFSAVFHLAALLWPQISIPEPQWEHVLFIGINTFLLRMVFAELWQFLVPALCLLLAEQVLEHVPKLIQAIQEGGFDLQSLLAVVGTTAALILAHQQAKDELV